MNTSPWDDHKKVTDDHMNDPQPGDIFSEMAAFWVYVLGRVGPVVITQEYGNGDLRVYASPKEMRDRFAYKSIPGYWVSYWKTDAEKAKRILAALDEVPADVTQ